MVKLGEADTWLLKCVWVSIEIRCFLNDAQLEKGLVC